MISNNSTATALPTISSGRRRSAVRTHVTVKYWRGSVTVAMLMIAIVGVRLHESLPYLHLLRPTALTVLGGGLLLLVKSSRPALREAVADRTAVLTLVYILWMLVTAPFALWPAQAFGMFQVSMILWVMTVSVLLCDPQQDVVRITTNTFAWIVGALALLALATGGSGGRLGTQGSLDPNDLAAVMAMGLPFAIATAIRERRLLRMAALLSAAFMAAVVVRTESRGGTIAFAIGALIFALGFPRRRALLLTVLGFAAASGWVLATPAFRERMSSISSLDQDYNYTAYGGRKQIWARARGYIADHPVTGLGAGNFGMAEGATAAARGQPAVWAAAHNAYLQAFAELGVLGGMLFLSLLTTSGYRGWKLWRGRSQDTMTRRPEFFASVCAFATSAYFLSHAYFFTFFAICAITALADRARTADPIMSGAARPPRRGAARPVPVRGGLNRAQSRYR
jgi:O-antigen ligase